MTGLIDRILNLMANHYGRIGKSLWKNENNPLSSGSITVNGLSNYLLFAVHIADNDVWMLAYSPPGANNMRGGTVYSNSSSVYAFGFELTRSGNKLTYSYAGYMRVDGSSQTKKGIREIVGLIPVGGGTA